MRNSKRNNIGTTECEKRNTDNNIIFIYLLNKYKSKFSIFQNREQKQKIFLEIVKDDDYKKLTKEEQTKLYTRLLSVI